MRLFAIFAILFVGATIAGSLVDAPMPRPIAHRAGYRVLEVDFHAHTRFSDGVLSPFDLVILAERRGLDAVTVSEHNMVFPAYMARWFSRIVHGPTVIIGEEVTTKAFHVHGVGITEKVDPNQPLAKILDDVHAQGGVTIAAHPVEHFWSQFLPVRDKLDATEVMHPLAYGSRGSGWRWEQMRDFYLNAQKEGFPMAAVGSSDYHFFSPLGVTRTLVFTDDDRDDQAAIVDALRARRTVVFDLDGHAYGDRELIAALAKEPYTPRLQDYGYHGANAVDRVARTIGWIAILAMVLFGAWRPRRA